MDTDRRVLLVHFDFAADNLPTGLWACPGGGLEPDETLEEGLLRELREEVGIDVSEPGPPIWWKEHVFPMSRWDGQQDTYFWVRVEPFEPRPQFTEAELRAEKLDGMRWWDYDELAAAQGAYDAAAAAGDLHRPGLIVFSPRRLFHHVRNLVEHGRPVTPITVDPP